MKPLKRYRCEVDNGEELVGKTKDRRQESVGRGYLFSE